MAINFVRNIISSGYNLTKINENFVNIETALQDAISRSGNNPNQMASDLDMNSNDLLNVNSLDVETLYVQGVRATPSDLVNTSNFATASQGIKADNSLQKTSNLSDLTDVGNAQNAIQVGATFESLSVATSSIILPRNKRIYVQFNSPNYADIYSLVGGANYREAINDSEYNALPSLAKFTTANGRKFVINERVLTPYMFGAKADATSIGVGTDALAAFNAMRDVAQYFKCAIYVEGYFRLSGSFLLDYSTQTGEQDFRIPVSFGGMRNTILYFDNGNFNGIHIRGGVTNATNPSFLNIRGVQLRKDGRQGSGLLLEGHFHLSIKDVHVLGFQFGINGQDIHECNLDNIICRFNNYGMKLQRVTFTQPNIMTLVNCTFGNNSNYGIDLINPATFQMIGGSIEGNGQDGADASKWGIRAIWTETTVEGSVGLNMFGVYLETNKGDADIWIVNNGVVHIVNNIIGCSHQKNSGTYFVNNCIRYDWSNGATYKNILNIQGCGFRSFNDYVASAARPYVNLTGGFIGMRVYKAETNFFGDVIETPDLSPWSGTSQGEILADATINSKKNISTATNPSAGSYTITFQCDMKDDTYVPLCIPVGGDHYIPTITAISASSFTVRWSTAGGVPTNTRWRFRLVE